MGVRADREQARSTKVALGMSGEGLCALGPLALAFNCLPEEEEIDVTNNHIGRYYTSKTKLLRR